MPDVLNLAAYKFVAIDDAPTPRLAVLAAAAALRGTVLLAEEGQNLVMRDRGLSNVWQLDGGILRCFEHTDGAPGWRARCFVFDERVPLDTALQA